MAVSSRGRTTPELQITTKRWKDRETSPERNKVWTEPPKKMKSERKVPVVYYLTRNGQLEHPHFMEVPISSSEGLYLRDVINRLNFLRGKGMAVMYSWSSKRSYKNGFVWHDLAENDFIYPAHGQEYVLKGSELLLLLDEPSSDPKSLEPATSTFKKSPETHKSSDESDFPMVVNRRRNQSWSSIDLHEYKVYKAESVGESSSKAAADASTQTDDKKRRKRAIVKEEEEEEEEAEKGDKSRQVQYENQSVELSREEISPPPSDSSPETLESLMKADGRLVLCPGGGNEDTANRTASNCPNRKMKAPSVLMQLISCGAVSFKDCGAMAVKDQGFSLLSHYKARLPRGAGNHAGKDADGLMENPSFAGLRLEDKEYFSGSLIETKKVDFPSLKRSSSYNADRRSQMELGVKEMDGVRAKCIPRRPKMMHGKKEDISSNIGSASSSSQHGSKRLEVHNE